MPSQIIHHEVADEKVAADPAGLSSKSAVTLFAILGAATAFVRGLHLDHLKHGTILLHPYFVGFYLASYQDGFRRRALVGSVVRLLFPQHLNVVWLNVAALMVLSGILAAAVLAFTRLCAKPSRFSTLFAFAFCASPMLAVLVEVIGDTLQIAFLVFLAALLGCTNLVKNPALKLLFGLASLVIGFFIHEASIFFIAPCIPFLVSRWPRARDFILPGLTAIACFLLAMHWSNLAPHLTYKVVLFHFSGPLAEAPITPGFRALLHSEHELYFGSRAAQLSFCMKCVKMLSLIFAALVALANSISTQQFKRVLYMLACMAVFFAPLWCIAHDWGRFFAYSLFLSLLLAAFAHPGSSKDNGSSGDILDWVAKKLQSVACINYVQIASVYLLLVSVFYDNFEHLILTPETMGFIVILAGGFILTRIPAFRQRNAGLLN